MDKRVSLSVFAVVLATSAVGIPARAADTSLPSVPSVQKKAAAAQPVAPRPAPFDPYRCQPSQDISCTVVRETAEGTLIVTMRRAGARTPAWMVISGAPPSQGPHPGGTVYVVPSSTAEAQPGDRQAVALSPNGAPIIE